MGKKNKPISPKTSKAAPPLKRKVVHQKNFSVLPWMFLVVVITAICFFPMLQNELTNWDDEFYVLNNALLRGPDWIGIFSKPVVSNYHPLTISTLAINYAMSGTDAPAGISIQRELHSSFWTGQRFCGGFIAVGMAFRKAAGASTYGCG